MLVFQFLWVWPHQNKLIFGEVRDLKKVSYLGVIIINRLRTIHKCIYVNFILRKLIDLKKNSKNNIYLQYN